MISRPLAIVVACLFAFGCSYPDIAEGGRCIFGATPSRCRPTYLCGPDNVCAPSCDAGTTLSCTISDGGAGTSTCSGSAWTACAAPGCTENQTEACPISMGGIDYYGERTCVDGGFTSCASVAASKCTSRPFGMCADAGRVFGDTVGCTTTSYERLQGFAADEQCPGDMVDNDCDGYVDELFPDAGIACGVGPVCATTGADGILKAYRTCQAPVCPAALLVDRLTDAGYASIDRCDDNIDRDCSGEVGVGPLVFMRRGIEAAVLGDSPAGDGGDEIAFRMVSVQDASDGGLEVGYSVWRADLGPVGNIRTFNVAGSADRSLGATQPNIQNASGFPTSVISWRSGFTKFSIAHAAGNGIYRQREVVVSQRLLGTPEVAQLGNDVLVAVPFVGVDAGTHTAIAIVNDFTGLVDAGTIIFDTPVVLRGDGTGMAGGFAALGGPSFGFEVQLDAGPGFIPLSDPIYYRLRPMNPFPTTTSAAITSQGLRRYALTLSTNFVALMAFTLGGSDDLAEALYGSTQLSPPVTNVAFVAGDAPDGGVRFLAAGTLANDTVGLFDRSTNVVRPLGAAAGKVSLTLAPAVPGYALLTRPMVDDGGTAIYGQFVCMPR